MSNVLALNGEIAPAPTVGVLQRGVLRRPVELTTQYPPRLVVQGRQGHRGCPAQAGIPLALRILFRRPVFGRGTYTPSIVTTLNAKGNMYLQILGS